MDEQIEKKVSDQRNELAVLLMESRAKFKDNVSELDKFKINALDILKSTTENANQVSKILLEAKENESQIKTLSGTVVKEAEEAQGIINNAQVQLQEKISAIDTEYKRILGYGQELLDEKKGDDGSILSTSTKSKINEVLNASEIELKGIGDSKLL